MGMLKCDMRTTRMTMETQIRAEIEAQVETYEQKLFKRPQMTMAEYIQEAYTTLCLAKADIDELESVHMDSSLVERACFLHQILSEFDAKVKVVDDDKKRAQQEWNALYAECKTRTSDLIESLRFALRNHTKGQKEMSIISNHKGDVKRFLIKTDVLVLTAKKYREQLDAIGYDFADLEYYEQLSAQLLKARASVSIGRKSGAFLIRRNITYTLLKACIDEIRRCGKYVFRNDKVHAQKYCSQAIHRRDLRSRNKKKRTNDEPS